MSNQFFWFQPNHTVSHLLSNLHGFLIPNTVGARFSEDPRRSRLDLLVQLAGWWRARVRGGTQALGAPEHCRLAETTYRALS